GTHLRVCAGEGGGEEATQDGPVALEVAVTILEPAHHHDRDVADPQVDVGAGQPASRALLANATSRKGSKSSALSISEVPEVLIRRPKARAIGVDQVPRQGVAAALIGGVREDSR